MAWQFGTHQNSSQSQVCFKNRFIFSQRFDRVSQLARMIFLSKQGRSCLKFSRAESSSRYPRSTTERFRVCEQKRPRGPVLESAIGKAFPTGHRWAQCTQLIAIGGGLALSVPPLTSALLGSAEKSRSWVAASVLNSSRQTDSVLGVALFGSLIGQENTCQLAPSRHHRVCMTSGLGRSGT